MSGFINVSMTRTEAEALVKWMSEHADVPALELPVGVDNALASIEDALPLPSSGSGRGTGR